MESESDIHSSPVAGRALSPMRNTSHRGLQAMRSDKLDSIEDEYILALTDCSDLSEVNVIAIRNKLLKK